MLTLPRREGPTPRTTTSAPHQQLDQTAPPESYAALKARAFDFPAVERRPSIISVPGAEALWLTEEPEERCAHAFLVGNEFAHVHPPYDGSLHMMLPRAEVHQVLEKGWGELHPLALEGLIPPTAVMIFGPRDDTEVDVVLELIGASHRFASGR
jgi:hypothetical protein